MLSRTLPFASILALAACVSVIEVPAEISSVKLVPEAGVPTDYCKRRTQGATNVVDVTFQNAGTADYAGGDPITVAFGRAVSRGALPAIAKGQSVTLAFPMPATCFNPDCEFTIKLANQPEVEGLCLG